MQPTSPWPWRAVQVGPGWMLQADDGSWVANFHSQADAEYVIAALDVYHRFHELEDARFAPKPASPLPWRVGTHHRFVKTANGVRRRSAVIDPSGREIAHVLTSEDGDFRDAEYLVRAANAYPRLKAQLEKALEACRLIVAAVEAETLGPFLDLVEMAGDTAREALEMAEGRDGDGGTSNAQGD